MTTGRSTLPVITGASGRSNRGSHQLGAVTQCDRKWFLHYRQRLKLIDDKPYRMWGTLHHDAIAHRYAERLIERGKHPTPTWWEGKSIDEVLAKTGEGWPNLIPIARKMYDEYPKRWFEGEFAEAWDPVAIEEEWKMTLGEMYDAVGLPRVYDEIEDEIVTCRTDLLVDDLRTGLYWVVDHKSKSHDRFNRGPPRLPPWKSTSRRQGEEVEYQIHWQAYINLFILRHNFPDKIVGGFFVNRFTRDEPFLFDRWQLPESPSVYERVPKVVRECIESELRIDGMVAAGERPTPNYSACVGRYGPCFLPGTLVTTPRGPTAIEEIEPGTEVTTHRHRWRPVLRTMGRFYAGEIVEIKAKRRTGLPLIATPEHPILVERDGVRNWVQAAEITKGDRLVVSPIGGQSVSSDVTLDRARLEGLFLAEGHTSGYQGRTRDTWSGTRAIWSFGLHEVELAEETVKLIERVHGKTAYIKEKQTALIVRADSAEMATYYRNQFAHRAWNKRIPDWLWGASKELVLEFFWGWQAGDGGRTQHTIYTTGTSKRVTIQMLALLAQHDIHPTCHKQHAQGGTVNGRAIRRREPLRILQFAGSARTAIEPEYTARLDTSPTMSPSGEVLVVVTEVAKKPYRGPVYNLEVEEDNTYVADGYVVHNCDYIEICAAKDEETANQIAGEKFYLE